LHSLEAIGGAGVLHRIDERIEELLLMVFKLPRRESVGGEVAERFGMKEPLATPQQVPMQRLVRDQVGDRQCHAGVVGVRLEESTDVWALELLLIDVRDYGWRPRRQASWKSSGMPA